MPSEAAWARVGFNTMSPRELGRVDLEGEIEDLPISDSCDVVR